MKTSAYWDELLKAIKGGNFEETDAVLKQMMATYDNPDLSSAVSQLVLQLTVCFGHSSLMKSLLLQYKVCMFDYIP